MEVPSQNERGLAMIPKPASPPAKSESKSPLPVPALYRDEGESEVESDDALDRPRSPHDEHQPMEVDVDAEGESDVADSDHDADSKTPVPRVVFDDDGESEMEEPESEEETDVPLSTVQKSKPASSSQGTYLHVSHKIFPNHSRPFGELAASTSTTARSTDAPFVPYARAPPTPPTHAAFQRSWLVPNPHIMHLKRRDQSLLESPSSSHPSTHTHDGHPYPHPHPHHRTLLPELRPKEVPQQYPYLIPRTPMPQERRPPGARKALRRPYPCLFHDCQQAFPSPKDRGRHMDKHFEGRFECLRCHKKYARLDALKRHSSEQFRPKSMPVDAASAKPYNVAAVSCIGGFELREWVELSGSRWLKPEHVLELRLPDPTDPLYDTLSRLMLQAHRDAHTYQAQQQPTASTSGNVQLNTTLPWASQPALASSVPIMKVKNEPGSVSTVDVEMADRPSDLPPPMASLLSESPKQQSTPAPPVSSVPSDSDKTQAMSEPAAPTPPSPQAPSLGEARTETSTPAITVEA